MKNKIILFAFLSTLIFITYAHAQLTSSQKAEEIFPILKWLVNTAPYNWYYYLVDLVNSYSVATNLKINQEIKNGDDVYLKFRAPSYVKEPNKRVVLREGFSYQYIRDITDTEINNGYTKFIVPVLQFPTSQKVSFVYFGIYEEDSSISPLMPEKKGSILVITPPLKYTYVPPKPKITIIPQFRTQEIREIRPNTTTEIQYAFEVTNVPTGTPFYLNSLTLRLNQQYQWPFKEIQVEVTKSDTTEKWSTILTATASKPYILTVTFPTNPNLPLTNGTYTVMLKGLTYSPQDKDFPYTNGHVSFRLTSVTAKDINNKIEVKSTGEDVSHTYKIIVPYYPNVTINAKVGSDEYPALVYEKQGNIATLYFTSFTGRFNAIHAGIQLLATSTLPTGGVTTTGITKTIEVNYNCGGTCPRTYEGLVAKFGSPDKWAIPLIRWDWSKTAQYTLNMYMNCSGWIPQINNSDPTKSKSFVFVCSNRKAFGNNFGWNRQLTVRLNWALTGNEKLNYEVFYPEAVKLSLKIILQKSLPALMFKVKR
jgi:hypothetical protein